MSHVISNINSILANISGQKANIEANLAAATQASLGVEADAQAAIDLLVERYKDVQVIGKIIGAQMAIGQLKAAITEVSVLEATLLTAIAEKHFVQKVTQRITADMIRDAANS